MLLSFFINNKEFYEKDSLRYTEFKEKCQALLEEFEKQFKDALEIESVKKFYDEVIDKFLKILKDYGQINAVSLLNILAKNLEDKLGENSQSLIKGLGKFYKSILDADDDKFTLTGRQIEIIFESLSEESREELENFFNDTENLDKHLFGIKDNNDMEKMIPFIDINGDTPERFQKDDNYMENMRHLIKRNDERVQKDDNDTEYKENLLQLIKRNDERFQTAGTRRKRKRSRKRILKR
jgi:hypothetical protein